MSKSNSTRLLAYNDADGHYERLHMETTANGNCLMVVDDESNSSLNTIEANSTLTSSRLNNIQNKLNQNSDGTGLTIGEMMYDTGDSKTITTYLKDLNTNNNSNLAQIRNKLSENGDNTGLSAGELLKDIVDDTDTCVSKLTDISSNASLSASRASNIQDVF